MRTSASLETQESRAVEKELAEQNSWLGAFMWWPALLTLILWWFEPEDGTIYMENLFAFLLVIMTISGLVIHFDTNRRSAKYQLTFPDTGPDEVLYNATSLDERKTLVITTTELWQIGDREAWYKCAASDDRRIAKADITHVEKMERFGEAWYAAQYRTSEGTASLAIRPFRQPGFERALDHDGALRKSGRWRE